MNEELQQPLITAAFECFRQLSECPELKNYRIYRELGSLPRQQVKECALPVGDSPLTATSARQWTGKWMLFVSANRLGKGHQLVVEVRGYRNGSKTVTKVVKSF
ncbi:MAG TPA: hypothetical protein V6C90_19945 [Coleofasciculaceae cyanobacterium]|jgi:hypothetical protein